MTNTDTTQRLIDLETRVTFQEQALQELNDIVTRQQAQLDHLARALAQVQELLRDAASLVGDPSREPPPPHY